jgi:putative PIN family toxin of toxin-antitoxin system
LEEYEGVLRRSRFRLTPRQVSRSSRLIRAAAKIVTPHRELKIARDPADNRFLECADAAKADYLVTGNQRHFPKAWRQTQVVNARELLEWIIPELQR